MMHTDCFMSKSVLQPEIFALPQDPLARIIGRGLIRLEIQILIYHVHNIIYFKCIPRSGAVKRMKYRKKITFKYSIIMHYLNHLHIVVATDYVYKLYIQIITQYFSYTLYQPEVNLSVPAFETDYMTSD